jgi:hypothetical protein
MYLSSWYTQWVSWIRGGVKESTDAHAVVIQKILDFLGDYYEEDISFLVLEECVLASC